MKKTSVLLILLVLLSANITAQVTLWDDLRKDSDTTLRSNTNDLREDDSIDSFIVPDAWDVGVDSLFTSLHLKHYINDINREGYGSYQSVCDSTYAARLERIPSIINLPYNEAVRKSIDLYVDRRRNLVERVLGLQALYYPMIEQTLDSYGLPLELKNLAIVESALNPIALSRMGASGLWQFMLPTGKFYGLEINSLIDERRDPVKATDAACRYFRDMYEIYGDWHLVIAAYNCGPGNVNKAIRRAGGKTDYWEISQYLPKETRSYVPLFIAANYVVNYHSYHNLLPIEPGLPVASDTVMVNDQLHFNQIAEVLRIDKELLTSLNPQYKREIIPGKAQERPLRLPVAAISSFITYQDSIFNHNSEELFPSSTYVASNADTPKNTPANTREKITHKVKNGESISKIAHKYGVTAANIREWNGLRTNKIIAGKNLSIYVDNGGYAMNSSSSSAAKKPSTSNTTYKVRSGDSYASIAKKYPGYSASDIMKLNNTSKSALKTGQVIKVPRL